MQLQISEEQNDESYIRCEPIEEFRIFDIVVDKEETDMEEDELMMTAIDAGAEDFAAEEDCFEVSTSPDDLETVREALEAAGIPMASAEVTMVPQTYTALTSDEDIKKMNKMLELLEDDDDVKNVYHNWDE